MPISCVIFTSLKVRVKLLWNQSVCGRRQRDRTVRLLTGSWICSRQAQVQMDVTAHLWHYYHIPFEFYSVFLLFLILVAFTINKLTNNTDQRNYMQPVLWYNFKPFWSQNGVVVDLKPWKRIWIQPKVTYIILWNFLPRKTFLKMVKADNQ